MTNWQPIATAPLDGTRILAYGVIGLESKPGIGTVSYGWPGEWRCEPTEATEYSPEPCTVTHWMPLPEPPL
jgi:hypothetical protein